MTTFVVMVGAVPVNGSVAIQGPAFLDRPDFDPYVGGVVLCGGRAAQPCRPGHRYSATFAGLRPASGSVRPDYKLVAFPEGWVFSAGKIDGGKQLTYTAAYPPA